MKSMSSPSHKGLPIYSKNMAHVMLNVSMPTPPCRFAIIARNSYIDDKAVVCVDLDDQIALVYGH